MSIRSWPIATWRRSAARDPQETIDASESGRSKSERRAWDDGKILRQMCVETAAPAPTLIGTPTTHQERAEWHAQRALNDAQRLVDAITPGAKGA